MCFLFGIALFILPSEANYVNRPREHLADTLRVKCDALPYRTVYSGTKCYFAVNQQAVLKEARAQCATIFPGAKVSSKTPGAIFNSMFLDMSLYHDGNENAESKRFVCVYDSGYRCDVGEPTLLTAGKCTVRAEAKGSYAEATRYCNSIDMEVPALGSDLENSVDLEALGTDPAWIQHTYKKSGSKPGVWQNAKNYQRFGTCAGLKNKQPQYTASQNKLWSCSGSVASVIDKFGYWTNVGQHHPMDVVCMGNARNAYTIGWKPCVALHEFDIATGECKWVGQKDACVQLITHVNKTWFMPFPGFPKEVYHHEKLVTTPLMFLNDNTVKVIVRKGCMFTGYQHWITSAGKEAILVENLVYGEHPVPSARNGLIQNARNGLTRPICYCDPAEATVNGHVPSPPADRKCIEHHEFNEETQSCEWTLDSKFCGELITEDGRRMLLPIPKWPLKRKYDVDHQRRGNENFHVNVGFHVFEMRAAVSSFRTLSV